MHRFFVPTDHRIAHNITLTGDIAHQIARVLRLRAGEEIVLIPTDAPDAVEWRVRLATVEARAVTGSVIAERPGLPEPACAVTLCAAVLKGERFDWLVQKATELGVAAMQPVITANTVRKVGPGETNALDRWRRIATEAAEQSGRSRVPVMRVPVALDALGESAPKPWFVAHESVMTRTLLDAVSPGATTVSLIIGPEGGLTDAEVERLTVRGSVPVSLGPRVLRAETAAITAVTLALAATTNLEPPHERAWREIRDTEEQHDGPRHTALED